jgi:hypothetical protein
MPAVSRKRRPNRRAKEGAKKRLKEAARALNQRTGGGTPAASLWGGARAMPPAWMPTRRRSFEGFLDQMPDPPKTPGKNARRASLDGQAAPVDDRPGISEAELRQKRRRINGGDEPKASRTGPPTKMYHLMHKGTNGVWQPVKAFNRLVQGRKKAELRVRRNREALMASKRKPSLADRMTTAALLMSGGGVTASKIPYVLAVATRYILGHVSQQHLLFATSTALDYVRTTGFCLKQRLVKRIGDAKAHFCVGTDTSSRGGTLGSYVVSFVEEGIPCHQFFAFDRPPSTTAPDLAGSLWKVAETVIDAGGKLVGIASDAPPTMIGGIGGVGTLLMEKAGMFVRHDTCEFHASARLLAVIDSLWPPQI